MHFVNSEDCMHIDLLCSIVCEMIIMRHEKTNCHIIICKEA